MDHRYPPFRDRRDAGRQLATALLHLKDSAPIVLALPRGGVPVALEVARALHAPLDVQLVRKIGSPISSELALGAIVDGDPPQRVLNTELLQMLKPSSAFLAAEEQRQLSEIARRRDRYRGGRNRIDIRGRTVIVVDDGIATGSTMKAALQGLRNGGVKRLIFAVPVAAPDSLDSLRAEADEAVCLLAPQGFRAVSQYYDDFAQTTDEEVIALLDSAAIEARPSTGPENVMKAISEVMTREVAFVSPQDNVQRAALLMRDLNVDALPVCDGQRLVGMITDRDITIRTTAPGQVHVADAMTDEALWCYEDQTVGEVLQQMSDEQIRRIPVVSRDKELVGMVSLDDIATEEDASVDATVGEISSPSEPNHPSADEKRKPGQRPDQSGGRA